MYTGILYKFTMEFCCGPLVQMLLSKPRRTQTHGDSRGMVETPGLQGRGLSGCTME